jgi:hypothetical protein
MISYEKAADVWVPFWKALPGNQYEVSTDGGVTWNAGSQTAGIELYYKQGTDWQVGDGAYNWLSEETVDSVQYTTYYLGQTVSEPVNFLGRNFYSTKRYPLKKLLPLTPAYASTYQIVQVEGTSNSMSWSDLEGNMHSALIPTYTYFLDGNDNEVFDGVGSGDIQLTTLNSYGGLTWNGTDFETVNIYMFMANIAPPPYFQNPETATVQALQSQLLSLASDANDLDFGVLSPNLKPLDSDPAFADLN